jgi:heme oxygenase
LHWRTFTAALDALELNEAKEARVIEGAQAVFRRVHALTDRVFAA